MNIMTNNIIKKRYNTMTIRPKYEQPKPMSEIKTASKASTKKKLDKIAKDEAYENRFHRVKKFTRAKIVEYAKMGKNMYSELTHDNEKWSIYCEYVSDKYSCVIYHKMNEFMKFTFTSKDIGIMVDYLAKFSSKIPGNTVKYLLNIENSNAELPNPFKDLKFDICHEYAYLRRFERYSMMLYRNCNTLDLFKDKNFVKSFVWKDMKHLQMLINEIQSTFVDNVIDDDIKHWVSP